MIRADGTPLLEIRHVSVNEGEISRRLAAAVQGRLAGGTIPFIRKYSTIWP